MQEETKSDISESQELDQSKFQKKNVLWSICIPTVPSRRNSLWRLLTVLEPQLQWFDDVELLILEDNRMRSYGEKLQAMVDIAQGTYISFVDDDDMVNPEYIACIHQWMDGKADCIGFKGEITVEGMNPMPVYYSKEYEEWRNEEDGYYRYPQHITPIKRSIVAKIPWKGHYGADSVWSNRLLRSKMIQTEYVVPPDKTMYYYCATQENRMDVWQ